jgi:hypothetical protein
MDACFYWLFSPFEAAKLIPGYCRATAEQISPSISDASCSSPIGDRPGPRPSCKSGACAAFGHSSTSSNDADAARRIACVEDDADRAGPGRASGEAFYG